jgi:hypothetical protein
MGRRPRPLAAALLVALSVAACGGDGDPDADRAEFCEQLDRLTRNDPFRAFGETASSADIEVAFGALVERSAELLELAPAEARGAAREYATSAEALHRLLAEVDFDGARVDARAYRAEQVTYAEAARRLERYLTAEC